ncbi:Glycoside hydrolase protein [Lasiodiplodia theobromae]|uniref:Glycoside hydrolase protein n=1 Tax=Lasiodiplodia theobromae TaxID=45133 RepID=UPI0015C33945|nr:Glycoside hydrolase protein [Lasiodiplodia theobromae]KAF4542297.1 Glycoside hydrolase protein [Lasiodiplodia theobromae]
MAAASSVPQEVLGLAIFVDCLSLIATVLGLLLCFMLWNHGERVSSIFTYNVDALLVLFWSIALFIGTWDIRMKTSSKKIMSAVFKTSAIVLPIAMCVVCSNDAIQQIPVAYLVLFNFIMAICLTTGSLLVIVVLLKYLQSRNLFTRFFPRSTGKSPSLGGGTMSSVATTRTQTGTDKWLIVRFSIIMICLLVFETAQIIYQIVNYERNRHDSRAAATSPDFSIEQAKVDISQDIPGTLPSIIATGIQQPKQQKAFLANTKAFSNILTYPQDWKPARESGCSNYWIVGMVLSQPPRITAIQSTGLLARQPKTISLFRERTICIFSPFTALLEKPVIDELRNSASTPCTSFAP